jgi:hypothetical protein
VSWLQPGLTVRPGGRGGRRASVRGRAGPADRARARRRRGGPRSAAARRRGAPRRPRRHEGVATPQLEEHGRAGLAQEQARIERRQAAP